MALGLMEKLLLVATIAMLAGCTSPPEHSIVGAISGLWQFPNKSVWIQIDPDGTAFQCRISRDYNVIMSRGSFSEPKSIIWEQEWGTDLVYIVEGGILLHGQYGKFTFVKATDPMNHVCAEARAAQPGSSADGR